MNAQAKKKSLTYDSSPVDSVGKVRSLLVSCQHNAPINDKPHPPYLGRGGGYVGLRSYNLCPVVGERPIDCLGVKVQLP